MNDIVAEQSAAINAQEGTITFRGEKLVKIYGRRRVVNDVSLFVATGEIVGLLGPNGAGKTTTFYMMTGMIKPKSGQILFGEQPVTHLPMYKRARLGIGYLAQEPSVFRKMTVEQNLMAILELMPVRHSDRKLRIEELIEEFSLGHVAKSKGYQLSGGERRRVEIARSLITKPKFILLDEPFAGIDPIAVNDIQEIVRGLKDRGIGVLITDHNVHETLAITDRSYLIHSGQMLKEGSAEFLANDEEARRIYLGETFKLDR
ncbi:LPS export ABC transporter ATP-binding protein [bacterium]|nr:LPS export ABC transporter ATP-binding protein [bacterium]MBU1637849.1 LPS export ABC transporter ATP-binding protein [bacterium]MBU1920526.1 LPS export ABC transporter ATP-binding protein [bacterium]